MSEVNPTYDAAVETLRGLYSTGVRDVHDPELFKAYESGVQAVSRLHPYVVPTAPKQVRHLLFRDMSVWER